MINSVLLPNERNQPLVDNLFTKKTFLTFSMLVYFLTTLTDISPALSDIHLVVKVAGLSDKW